MIIERKHFSVIIVILGLVLPASAATILHIGSLDLINKSEAVFEATVISTRSEFSPQGQIYTYVDFEIVEVIAGELVDDNQVTLRFTGGTVGDLTLDVGSIIPELGEHGIYFVESLSLPLINPIFGWSQGHFKIIDRQVIAADDRPIISVEAQGTGPSVGISRGVAKGIMTLDFQELERQSVVDSLTRAMSLDEFKAVVRSLRE